MRSWGAALVCGAAMLAASEARIVVDPASQLFVDSADGRVKVFHGVNVVYKLPPYVPTLSGFDPQTSLSDVDLAQLQAWGINMVRLGVMWEAVEPSALKGAVNSTYLALMRSLVDHMGSFGIYSLIDAHQDDVSRQFCGEGFPDFAVRVDNVSALFKFPFPVPVNLTLGPDGYPTVETCTQVPFAAYLATPTLNAAWQSLYTDLTVQALFAAHWRAVASAFNTSQFVLGYELLNEPWCGDVFEDPLIALEQGRADQKNLGPLYQQLYRSIRSVDAATPVFYEPSVHELYLSQHTGFTAGPGGAGDNDRQVFAFHVYCYNQNATGDITDIAACEKTLDNGWAIEMANAKTVGGGRFLTEFGAVGPHLSSAQSLNYILDKADSDLVSWSYWTFKGFEDITTQNAATESFYNDDGTVQPLKVAALTRTYAPEVPAVPSSLAMFFNSTDPAASFSLSYEVNPNAANRTTRVFFQESIHYPNGYTYALVPPTSGVVSYVGPNTLHIDHSAVAQAGVQVQFTLSAN